MLKHKKNNPKHSQNIAFSSWTKQGQYKLGLFINYGNFIKYYKTMYCKLVSQIRISNLKLFFVEVPDEYEDMFEKNWKIG